MYQSGGTRHKEISYYEAPLVTRTNSWMFPTVVKIGPGPMVNGYQIDNYQRLKKLCSRYSSRAHNHSLELNQLRHSFFFSFFGLAHGMWKFPSQGLNPHHSGNLSHCSGNTTSLTCCSTGELQMFLHEDLLRISMIYKNELPMFLFAEVPRKLCLLGVLHEDAYIKILLPHISLP